MSILYPYRERTKILDNSIQMKVFTSNRDCRLVSARDCTDDMISDDIERLKNEVYKDSIVLIYKISINKNKRCPINLSIIRIYSLLSVTQFYYFANIPTTPETWTEVVCSESRHNGKYHVARATLKDFSE